MEDNYKIESLEKENIPIIEIIGDMTSDADADLNSTYDRITTPAVPRHIVISFEKTKYINSAGIASLINIIQTHSNQGGQIAFSGLSSHFQKVMDIVGLSDFVEMFPNVDEAVKKLKVQ